MFNQVMMLGGGKELKTAIRGGLGTNKLSMMAMLVLFFMLKVLVVQWAYNKVAPILIGHWKSDAPPFKPLTFDEALMFTLLVSFLF